MGGFRIKVIEVDCPIGIDGVRRLKYYANNNKLYWNSVSNASKYNVYYSQSSSNGPIANNEQAAEFQSLVGFLNGIPRDLDVRFEPFVSPLPKAFLCRVHP